MFGMSEQHEAVRVCELLAMRRTLIAAVFFLASCSGTRETATSILGVDKPTRVGQCTVLAGAVNKLRVSLQFTCRDVPAGSAKWWGDSDQPLGFELELGECMRLGSRYYCVASIDERGRQAEIRPLYDVEGGGLLLRRVRP